MAQHNQYWSNTKFAGWIRGVAKPYALTSEGWDEWNDSTRKAYPVRYWIAEEALDWLQDFVTWPIRKLYDIKYYINNRWVTRTHALTAHPRDIKPGQWQDVGNRFLPCLFNELVDFVEVELAWHQIAWGDEEVREKYKPPFWAMGWFRWRTWRCAEAGLDSLEWQSRLTMGDDNWTKDPEKADDPTPQAVKAQEIMDLYNWWTQVYPNRPDPYEVSGWSALCEEERAANGGKLSLGSMGKSSPALRKRLNQAHKMIDKIEKDNEKEDEVMMIRLIKVRRGLWT
jgi:hypothetical protein